LAEDSYIALFNDSYFAEETVDEADETIPISLTEIHLGYETDETTTPDDKERTYDQASGVNTITDLTEDTDIRLLQRQCPDFRPVFDYMEREQLPADDKAARKLILESENFVNENGILYHTFSPRRKRLDQIKPVVQQLCVPKTVRERLLKSYHDEQCHIGQERLYSSLKLKYWFPLMYSSVLSYVRVCETCQKTKTSKHQKRAPLKPLEVAPAFGRVHLDFIGPLPTISDGYKHLLVIVDSTTL